MKRIKLAFIIGSMGNARAGTEKSLLTLAQSLDRTQFEPILVTLQDCEYMQSKRFICETHCLHLYRMFTPQMYRARRDLAAMLKMKNIEVVQTFFTEAHLVGGGAALLAGVNATISSRRNLGYAYGTKERLFLRIANRYPHRLLANSKAVADAISKAEGISLSKIDVIYNGVDPGTRLHSKGETSSGAKRVVLVANLRAVKSVDTLLHAAPAVIEQFPDVRFEIIGDGSDRRRLEQIANRLRLGQHLIFHGSRPDVNRLLPGAAVGVLTSISEGFSNSILEYMRASLPVVATAVGGNLEVVKNGQTGYLIPPGDPKGLAQKLTQLLGNAELRSEMGEAGRDLLESQFALGRMINAHQEHYRALINSGDSKRPVS